MIGGVAWVEIGLHYVIPIYFDCHRQCHAFRGCGGPAPHFGLHFRFRHEVRTGPKGWFLTIGDYAEKGLRSAEIPYQALLILLDTSVGLTKYFCKSKQQYFVCNFFLLEVEEAVV